MDIIEGIALIIAGVWLIVVQVRAFVNKKPNTLGGHSRLLIIGIALVIFGIMSLTR